MSAVLPEAGAGAAQRGSRPDVLCFPSPAASQFLILVAALLTAGLFVGDWLHNLIIGGEWTDAVGRCSPAREATTDPEELLRRQADFESCVAPVERQRALYAVGGLGVAALGGSLALVVAPWVIVRRRHLRPLPVQLGGAQERFGDLAMEVGVRRVPELMLGPSSMRDAFSFGLPGRYRVALPPKAAVSFANPAVFVPIVRHELAHVARHDVTYAWLARCVWYVLIPMLVLPVIYSVVLGDTSLLIDYAWRALALAAVVRMVTDALLRSREHEADLVAVRGEASRDDLRALVARADAGAATGWRRAVALHPSSQQRVSVLDNPVEIARLSVRDGLAVSFLAAVSAPLIVAALVTALTGSGRLDIAYVSAAMLVGPLLGTALGIGLWRAAVMTRLGLPRQRPWRVAVGVGIGLVLGESVSLARAGTPGFDLDDPRLVVLGLAGAGGTALVGGLGEVWADAAPAARRPPWRLALVAGTLVFVTMTWAVLKLGTAFALGWQVVRFATFTAMAVWPVALVAVVLSLIAAVGLSRASPGSPAPGWATESGAPVWPRWASLSTRRVVLLGLMGGTAGASVLLLFRVVSGAAASASATEQRFYLYLWLAVLAGQATLVVLCLAVPYRGAALGLIAAPVATLTVIAGFLLLNTMLGGMLSGGLLDVAARPALVAGLLLGILCAVAALLPLSTRPWSFPRLVTGVIALSLALAALSTSVAAETQPRPSPSAAYVEGMAADLLTRSSDVDAAVRAIADDSSATGYEGAWRVRSEVLPLIESMRTDAEAYEPSDEAVAAVHALAVEALSTMSLAFEGFASSFEAADEQLYAEAARMHLQGMAGWARWREEVEKLADPAP